MQDSKRRLLWIGQRYHLSKHMKGVYEAFGRRFDMKVVFVEDGWPSKISDISNYKDYDVCVWFVRFRELINQEAFNWRGYHGKRIMYDWDVHANYHTMLEPKWIGKWPEVFRKNGFHVLMTTSKKCCQALEDEDIQSFWLPKAYNKDLFHSMGLKRKGICYYGNRYISRKAMLDYLKRHKIDFSEFKCKHNQLNDYLNKYVACLICNLGGTLKHGLHRLLHYIYPSRGVSFEPGFEPMLKIFEVAAAGCAPIADRIDEHTDLGYIDSETMVEYENFDALVDKLRYYERNIDSLIRIGERAGELALNQHTWDHRAGQFDTYLSSL